MMFLTRRAMGASSVALLAGCATGTVTETAETAPTRAPAAIGAWGVDLAARDTNVKPGDDFFRYANGTWMTNTQIPADRTRWGTFDILREKADNDARVIIEEVALAGGASGTNQQKIADFYNSFLNQQAIDAAGLTPLQTELAEIQALRNHEETIRLVARPGVAVNFADRDLRRPR
jgi:putative endopeptidase